VADRCAESILELVASGDAELMLASHNQGSVERATRAMHHLGLDPSTSGASSLLAPCACPECPPPFSAISVLPCLISFSLCCRMLLFDSVNY
jgi:hypothetical protein